MADSVQLETTSHDLAPLRVLQTSSYEQIAQIQMDAMRAHAARLGRPLAILEAGCGQRWNVDLTGIAYTLTGVDLDAAAIELRIQRMHDLDFAIVGDLCTLELPKASFDVVFSSFVLEHVPRADVALANMIASLRPGGLFILRVPERESARAFFTRVRPHPAHVWFYRYVYGRRQAGKPGHAPYPTYFHPVMGRRCLAQFLAQHGVKSVTAYGDGFRRDGSGIISLILHGFMKLTAILSLGRLTADYCDVLYVARKDA